MAYAVIDNKNRCFVYSSCNTFYEAANAYITDVVVPQNNLTLTEDDWTAMIQNLAETTHKTLKENSLLKFKITIINGFIKSNPKRINKIISVGVDFE